MRQEEEGGESRDDISSGMFFQEFLFPLGPSFPDSCRVSNIQFLIYRDTLYSNHSINQGAKPVVSMRWPICYNVIIEKLKNSGGEEEKRKPRALI